MLSPQTEDKAGHLHCMAWYNSVLWGHLHRGHRDLVSDLDPGGRAHTGGTGLLLEGAKAPAVTAGAGATRGALARVSAASDCRVSWPQDEDSLVPGCRPQAHSSSLLYSVHNGDFQVCDPVHSRGGARVPRCPASQDVGLGEVWGPLSVLRAFSVYGL